MSFSPCSLICFLVSLFSSHLGGQFSVCLFIEFLVYLIVCYSIKRERKDLESAVWGNGEDVAKVCGGKTLSRIYCIIIFFSEINKQKRKQEVGSEMRWRH